MNGEGFGKWLGNVAKRSETSSTRLLHALFAEAGAFGGSLAGLELRVALADDIERAFTLHDLAVFVALFHGEE